MAPLQACQHPSHLGPGGQEDFHGPRSSAGSVPGGAHGAAIHGAAIHGAAIHLTPYGAECRVPRGPQGMNPSRKTSPCRRRKGLPARRARLAWRPVALLVLLALLAPAAPPTARAASPDEPVTLNFQDADLDVVLDAVAQAVGFNYVLAPEVRRKVTVHGRVPRKELFDLLLSILEVHGLTAVKSGDLYKIIRIAT